MLVYTYIHFGLGMNGPLEPCSSGGLGQIGFFRLSLQSQFPLYAALLNNYNWLLFTKRGHPRRYLSPLVKRRLLNY